MCVYVLLKYTHIILCDGHLAVLFRGEGFLGFLMLDKLVWYGVIMI